MFSHTALSCCLLLLASSSSCYILGRKFSVDQIPSHFIAASIGVFGINFRAFFNLFAPFLFHTRYSIDPLKIIQETSDECLLRVCPIHEKFCRIINNSGFLFALFDTYNNRKVGIFIISTLTCIEIVQIFYKSYPRTPFNKVFHFMWMGPGILYGWRKGNYFCVYSYIPYGISFLSLMPENRRSWSTKRIINNYMMMAYMFLQLDAIRSVNDFE